MAAWRLVLLAAIAAAIGCDGPPDSVEAEPLVFARQFDELPVLSDLCSPRGRLFAVGRDGGDGVFMEERSAGLVEVDLALELESSVAPLSACWQNESAEVFAVGDSQVLLRSPEGEYSVSDLEDDIPGTIELSDVSGSNELGVLAVGSLNGAGAMFRYGGETGWQQVELDAGPLPPLSRIATSGPVAHIVGEQGAILRWTSEQVELFVSLNQRLTGVAVSGEDTLAFALDGAIIRLDGNQLVEFAELEARWLDGGFTADGSLWMVGSSGVITRHNRKPSGALSPVARQAVTPDQSELIAVEPGRDRLLVLSASREIWELVER
jgi:hypothetical protein